MNRQGTDLGYLLHRATRLFRLRLADALSQTGLTPQQAAVLIAISTSAEGRLTPRVVAESIGADAATTTGLLDRLNRDGWLRSESNPADGRSRIVSLTAQAEASLPEILNAAQTVSQEATSCLSASELDALTDLLARVCEGEHSKSAEGGDSR